MRASFSFELQTKPGHDSGNERPPLGVLGEAPALLVVDPKPVRRVGQKRVGVLGELQVLGRATHLQNGASLALERAPHGHPDDLHEEEVHDDHAENAQRLTHPSGGLSQVSKRVHRARARHGFDVVLQHQTLSCEHRCVGFVLVGTFRQSQESGDALEQLRIARAPLPCIGNAGCARVDASISTHGAKRWPVRGLVPLPEHFVHELVGHLVLEHFDEHPPAVCEEQLPRELETARITHPTTQTRFGISETKHGAPQDFAEVRGIELVVRGSQRPNQSALQVDAQSLDQLGRAQAHVHRTLSPCAWVAISPGACS